MKVEKRYAAECRNCGKEVAATLHRTDDGLNFGNTVHIECAKCETTNYVTTQDT